MRNQITTLLTVITLTATLQMPSMARASTNTAKKTHNLMANPSAGISTAHYSDRNRPQVQGGDGPGSTYFFPLIAHTVPSGGLPAFPGAEGFGTTTPAGRRGRIIRVTTLADSGVGSLRKALSTSGPRTIVFEVGGIIWLERDLNVLYPFVTIAGQTAPPPGITLANAALLVKTHDVLVQHLYIRPGDGAHGTQDGLGIVGSTDGSDDVYNIVIDHCSISWALNKNLIIWTSNGSLPSGASGVHDVTIRNCIVSESLRYPSSGNYMGALIGDHSRHVTMVGNLLAHNSQRNPAPFGDTSSVIVNNVVYNARDHAIHLQDCNGNGPLEASIVGNVIIDGPSTPSWCPPIEVLYNTARGTQIYQDDNQALGHAGSSWAITRVYASFDVRAEQPPLWNTPLTVRRSDEAMRWVLTNAGARPWDRDAVDKRVISDVLNGTGRLVDSQEEVGGWPRTSPTSRPLDLPDNPNGDDNGNGYTNLEEWLWEFEQAPMPAN